MLFFFSSRRRHTRWNCDWSSDVCSSDLLRASQANASRYALRSRACGASYQRTVVPRGAACTRSEERRVGKECRARWMPNHKKKKKHLVVKSNGKCSGMTSVNVFDLRCLL